MKITVIGRTVYDEIAADCAIDNMCNDVIADDHMLDNSANAAHLAEFAGRLCYMSYGKGRKSTDEYIENILAHAHGSVLEHVNYTVLIEGVSRTLTHELVRHRAGTAYSQLSQRYVDESEAAFVWPNEYNDLHESIQEEVHNHILRSQALYLTIMKDLSARYQRAHGTKPPMDLVKAWRGAARKVLPQGTETKIVMTANVRAWRNVLEQRGSLHADPEIRQLAVALYQVLSAEAPVFFADFELHSAEDRGNWLSCKYRKV